MGAVILSNQKARINHVTLSRHVQVGQTSLFVRPAHVCPPRTWHKSHVIYMPFMIGWIGMLAPHRYMDSPRLYLLGLFKDIWQPFKFQRALKSLHIQIMLVEIHHHLYFSFTFGECCIFFQVWIDDLRANILRNVESYIPFPKQVYPCVWNLIWLS